MRGRNSATDRTCRRPVTYLGVAWGILAGFLCLPDARADLQHELDYVRELRARDFAELAELQSRRLLADTSMDATDQVALVVELSQALSQQALAAEPPHRETLWRQAEEVLATAAKAELSPAWRLVLDLQSALTTLQRAEWDRRVAEVRAQQADDWEASRTLLRDALGKLRALERGWTQPRMRAGSEGLTAARVEELLRNTHYQQARAYRNQALTYPEKSTDRTNSLTLALARLDPIAGSAVADDLVWKSRLDRITCTRLLGELERTRSLLRQLDDAPEVYVGRLAAEGVYLALAAQQPEAALRLVGRKQSGPPEFELARIETWVALAAAEPDEQRSRAYRTQAADTAARLRRDEGAYWGLRGEMLIAKLASPDGGGTQSADNTLLDTAARTYLQRGLPDEAIKLFIEAAQRAEAEGDVAVAFVNRRNAALVERREGRLQPAIDRFRDVAVKFPQHPEASATHQLAAFEAAAYYQQQARGVGGAQADRALRQYEDLLAEHLDLWPDQDTANRVRLWAARLANARRQWESAADLLYAVSPTSPDAAAAHAKLLEVIAATLRPGSHVYRERLATARQRLDVRATETMPIGARVPLELTRARLDHWYDPPRYENVWLPESRLDDADPSAGALKLLQAHHVLLAFVRGPESSARDEWQAAQPMNAPALVELMRAWLLVRDTQPMSDALRRLLEDSINQLRTYQGNLTAADRKVSAQAQAELLEEGPARAAYAKLSQDHPDDLRIQRRYAELLAMGRDRQSRAAALAQWRVIVRLSQPQTVYWFRGKLGVAQAHFDAGAPDKAKQVIDLLLSLYPDLSGSGLQAAYERLRARCEALL